MHGIIGARLGTNREPIVHNDDERRLIERAKQGDLTALGTLYNLHVDRIYQYALYRTGDDQTAEDIAAEVFLRAIESIGNYEDQGVPFAAWLYRIAHARVVDFWRSQSVTRPPRLKILCCKKNYLHKTTALISTFCSTACWRRLCDS